MAERDLGGAARRAVFDDLRRAGRARWIRVDGPSMWPLIVPGSWLLVDFAPFSPQVGQIVLASLTREFVVHRVVRVRGDRILLQGDAELRADPVIARVALYGVVRAVRRTNGRATSVGCDGASARLIAIASRAAARAVNGAYRATGRLPTPIRRVLVGSVGPMARVPVRVLATMALVGQRIGTHRGTGSA
jgi:peptidase S24-like protein